MSCVLIGLGGGGALLLYLRRQRDLARASREAKAAQVAAEALLKTLEMQKQEDAEMNYRGQIEAIDRSHLVLEMDTEGMILRVNQNYLSALGYGIGELEGQPHSILVAQEESTSAVYQDFWRALKSGTSQSGEFKRVCKDQRERWMEASYNPIFDRDGPAHQDCRVCCRCNGTIQDPGRTETPERGSAQERRIPGAHRQDCWHWGLGDRSSLPAFSIGRQRSSGSTV